MADTDWQASSMRTVLFTQRALPLTTDVFTAFAGEPPDSQEDRPKQGIRVQVGMLEDAELRATINPVMVDFVLKAPPLTVETVMSDSWLLTGELNAELAKFERMILAWLPKWEVPTTRISLVIEARVPTSSVEEAYKILQDNLSSVKVKPGEMSELFFRVNWKVKTNTIDEKYYNRVTTWNALQFKSTAGMVGGGAPNVDLEDRNFAQVTMDINTPAERAEPLERDKLKTIYGELFQLAVKIAEGGEGP